MSDRLKIKLSIANRIYPLTITPDQEEGLRLAAQKIDSTIKQFEKSYSVQDKQDVLAMCALQFATQNEQKTIDNTSLNYDLESRLIAVDKLLDSHLDNNVL
ncbi:MAG: cell division protein ZapA [Flavobacteriales bacterium]|mgnify:FL=1|jgi:cell division protein ZapA (FtsZ GTPase activity inhibitor)|tara:strand:+ start:253 stop:555 length:303 start_codon:yes stop_codon:yes gene_type:complete